MRKMFVALLVALALGVMAMGAAASSFDFGPISRCADHGKC